MPTIDLTTRERACTEGIQNLGHLKYNLITRQACPKTKYICSVTPPEISEGPAIDGSNRIRKSWELLTEAEDTPAKYKDLGWRQAMLPTITGGSGVDTGVTSVGVPNDTGGGRTGVRGPAEAYYISLLKCWSKLVACSPDLAEAERSGGYGARDAAVNSYRAALSRRDEVASIRAARDDNIYYTLRGGKISEFYPKGVSLPTSESLPTPESVIDGTCKSGSPYARALAAIETIWNWFDLQKEWRALDDYTAANWQPGDTKIRLRESIRYVSTAQPYAGRWLDTKLDGSNATCIPDDIFIGELQRRNGLHLSQCRSTVTRALELGDTVGGAKDYHGDWFLNNAARRRPHDGVLRAWYDCVHAVSVSRPVMGDAEKPELTKQFNEGYKTDLAEPGEAPGGKDEISEVKLWTPLRGGLPVGVGRADTGGNPGSVGDKFAFGNTEERARLANMGCKQRGFRGQRAFDHTTGQGYVKSQRGHYHDGIFTKRNKFNLLLHETFGGGFSPPAVAKINRLARKAQRSGVDRTAYPPHSRLSFVSHHAERISIASVKGVNRAILDRRAKLASELSRRA